MFGVNDSVNIPAAWSSNVGKVQLWIGMLDAAAPGFGRFLFRNLTYHDIWKISPFSYGGPCGPLVDGSGGS